jgi:hypothetical protein
MNTECARIADQLNRAFTGDAWHGPPLREILSGIGPSEASARPLPSAHTIWELVLHINIDMTFAIAATKGTPMPTVYGAEIDWPAVADASPEAWTNTCSTLFQTAAEMGRAISSWTDSKLLDTVPGRDYNFYVLFHGVVQHGLYHGGQIALLKKAAGGQ